jgi:tetratricopeptide (TPR) repeat protein
MVPIPVQHLIQQAIGHHRAGRFADAESSLRQALTSDANNPDALYLLGMLAIQTKRPAEAVEWLTRAVQVRPEAAEYHANLGHALRSMNRLDEAAARYEQAVRLNPSYALAHINLGAIRRAPRARTGGRRSLPYRTAPRASTDRRLDESR